MLYGLHRTDTTHLARTYDPERHTPDWPGYLAYLGTRVPDLYRFFYRRLPVLIPEEAREKHTYITGQSGAGKSELLKVLLHSYVRSSYVRTHAPIGLVLIDPHGDLAEEVARFPEVATSGRLIFIQPGLSTEVTPTINPFDLADRSELSVHVMAEQLSGVFDQLMCQAGHRGLTGNMGALLVPCISTLLLRPGSSIRDLQTFMDDRRNADLIAAGSMSALPIQRDFFRYKFADKQFDSTKAALFTRIQSLLNSPVLYRLLVGRSTLDLEAAVNAGKIIIFSLPKGIIGGETSPAFGSFVLALLQGIAIRREKRDEARLPVHVFLDECQNFLTPTVTTILTESRKFGLHLTLAQQTFLQGMEGELAAAVAGNTAIKFCGMNDVKTLRPMDERLSVGLDTLGRLRVGEFFGKVSGSTPAFKLHVPRVREQIDTAAWCEVKAAQLATYYRPTAEKPPEAHSGAVDERSGSEWAEMPLGPDAAPGDVRLPPKPQRLTFI
ncbi:MAG: DUF87 domain-containing protein [Magnetospirillum sp.]|nr:MAG: DUF87 domain-containing protein [Magnetospirillum sp.]